MVGTTDDRSIGVLGMERTRGPDHDKRTRIASDFVFATENAQRRSHEFTLDTLTRSAAIGGVSTAGAYLLLTKTARRNAIVLIVGAIAGAAAVSSIYTNRVKHGRWNVQSPYAGLPWRVHFPGGQAAYAEYVADIADRVAACDDYWCDYMGRQMHPDDFQRFGHAYVHMCDGGKPDSAEPVFALRSLLPVYRPTMSEVEAALQ